MLLNIQQLIDEAKCYAVVREMRWSDGVKCPHCGSGEIIKRGFHNQQAQRQRYECQACRRQFDDLTGTIFEGHHQPLRAWVLCLYFMGLNLSNQQIAAELDLDKDVVQDMTTQLREGIVAKKSPSS
jgi:transposase-like protein